MSQMTDHDHDSVRDPWASPYRASDPNDTVDLSSPPHQVGSPPPNVTQPLGYGGWPPAPTDATFATNATAGGDATSVAVARRERHRPGWTGVVAVGAGAAVLSSLLTAGAFTAFTDRTAASSSSSSSGSSGTTGSSGSSGSSGGNGSSGGAVQQSAPLVNGSTISPNWNAVASAVEPSVVSVRVSNGQGSGGEGSGVIFDTSGHVLTNNHVVAEAGSGGSISVVLSDGRTYPATVVGTDASTDLAVIKLTKAPSDLKAATFGNSDAVKVGDAVMALGNPLGLSDTVTTGIISALNRPVTTSASSQQQQNPFGQQSTAQSEAVVTNAIQTDAAINPGNSGGALVDGSGRVIGITSSIAALGASTGSSQSGSIGLGFAIPANEAKSVAQQLIDTGTVQHAYLGVTLADGTVTADGAQRQAAVIGTVSSGTPAAQAGLKAKDAVIAVGGNPIDGADSLVARIRALSPGSSVKLTIVRDGQKQDVSVTLAKKPASTTG